MSSVVTCTLVTLRMYVDHKGYDIPEIKIEANMYQKIENEETKTYIEKRIQFGKELDQAINDRLLRVAAQCPISKLLKQEIVVNAMI